MKNNSQKYLIQFLSYLIILYLGTSCTDVPTFPKEPKIELISMKVGSLYQGLDTVNLTIKFQDGDGDLGLPADVVDGKFADSIYVIVDGDTLRKEPNRFFFNYFVDSYKLIEDEYQQLESLQDGRFPVLSNTQGTSVIEGELQYRLRLPYNVGTQFRSGDVIKFQISIADRALNISNVVETDSIVLGTSL